MTIQKRVITASITDNRRYGGPQSEVFRSRMGEQKGLGRGTSHEKSTREQWILMVHYRDSFDVAALHYPPSLGF